MISVEESKVCQLSFPDMSQEIASCAKMSAVFYSCSGQKSMSTLLTNIFLKFAIGTYLCEIAQKSGPSYLQNLPGL